MIYRFGKFHLDDSRRELREDGRRVDTEPKAFELLLYLLQHRDRAVSKDELLNELWPDTIVSETALTRCIMKARRAVGDDSTEQAVIRTLHGHGYRFVARLDGEQATAAAPERQRTRWSSLRIFIGAPIVIAVLATFLLLREDLETRADVGALAVLPVNNQLQVQDYTWVRVGLMSLMKRMLEDGGVEVVAERAVLRAIGDATLSAPPDDNLFKQIRQRSGADSVLHTTLDAQGGLRRLSAVITHSDGRKTRRVIVGDSPAALAAEMAGVIADLLSSRESKPENRFSKVSTDPFVNEMYARALDLELQGKLEEARNLFQVAADQEPELFWLRYEIALCTRDLREWEAAERMFASLYEEARSGEDARALLVTLNSQGVMHFKRNNYDASEKFLLQALDTASERAFATDRASVHTNLALIYGRRGDINLERRHYDLALESFAEGGRDPAPTFHNNYAGLLMRQGDLEAALAHSEKAVEGFRLRGQRRFEAPSLNRQAKIVRRLGDTGGAIARHEQALTIYRELRNTPGELSVMLALTTVYREEGDLTRARHNIDDVLERAAQTDDRLLLADAYVQSAYVESDLGNASASVSDFETAHTMFEEIGDDEGLRATETGMALAAVDSGDTGHATAIATAMLRSAVAAGNDVTEARARWLLGTIATADGDLETGRTHFGSALAYARASGDVAILAKCAVSLGALELDAGNPGEAAVLVEEARAHAAARHDFQRLDARLALARDNTAEAIRILTALRQQAGEAWQADDEELLQSLGD